VYSGYVCLTKFAVLNFAVKISAGFMLVLTYFRHNSTLSLPVARSCLLRTTKMFSLASPFS
jgi:hypothetical protein